VAGGMPTDGRFESLYDEYRAAVGAYCRRRLPRDAIDDVMAEVFETGWRRIDHIPVGAELPWLYGVARNVIANQRRGVSRRTRLVSRLLARTPDRRQESTFDSEWSGATAPILDALATLAPSDQEVLRLRAWEELTITEIAIVLGTTAHAVEMRLSRAKRRLERALESTKQNGLTEATPTPIAKGTAS
jgi:RNA polymerase sigma factor (sigma-70 family)